MKVNKQTIKNWGNYPVTEASVIQPQDAKDCNQALSEHRPIIARGLARSYGDASLNGNVLDIQQLNRFLHFDRKNGLLKAESGVSLQEILEVSIPEGWFLPVTPGTKYVTLGGAVAADVHGKNHHKEGSFQDHVTSLDLLTPQNTVVNCSRNESPELFNATCGGMGLTGIILRVTFRLKKISTSRIRQTNYKAQNLEEIFRLFEDHQDSTYTVAWTDCLARRKHLGRSILMTGEHAEPKDLPPKAQKEPIKLFRPSRKNMPFYWPSWVLNSWSVSAFNALYYRKNSSIKNAIVPYEPYFYPLDAIRNWNRMYGKKGFVQYQFVLPLNESFEGIKKVLEMVTQDQTASFLVVLKKMGKGHNMLSFPMEGYTLALDFPVSKRTFRLLEKLDKIIEAHNGRIYLAKDARMSSQLFQNTYSGYPDFRNTKNKVDPQNHFSSHLSERLKI